MKLKAVLRQQEIGVNLERLSGQVKGYKKSIGAETLIWR